MKNKVLAGGVETTLGMVGSKWKFLIIRELLDGTKRFGEIKESLVPITQKVLAQSLRELEESGLLKRKVYAQVPPRVDYSLTKTGESLMPVINAMTNWGNFYTAKKLKLPTPEVLEVQVLDETPDKVVDERPKRNEIESFLL